MTTVISIQEAMALMSDEDSTLEFSITFVRASGEKRGQLCHIQRARRGTPSGREGMHRSPGQQPSRRLHVERGTIPVVDIDRDKYISPVVSHIVKFNNLKVIH